jgi:hypothetical protein
VISEDKRSRGRLRVDGSTKLTFEHRNVLRRRRMERMARGERKIEEKGSRKEAEE